MTIRRMRTACWIPKDTNTTTECVILIALQPQKYFLESASVLRYTYIACLAEFSNQVHIKCGSDWP
jgi:hypothetical protein